MTPAEFKPATMEREMTMQEKIAAMQTKRNSPPRVWQDSDGLWHNKFGYHDRFARKEDAEMAARWAEGWGCK